MVRASHCVGFTLPGMMDDPGSFSGMIISPIPERGPEASILMSLAILFKATANCFKAPCVSTIASCAANASNLFGAVTNGNRSEEHTSELQSRPHLVCRLLLEKK